jgi:hypothetical protein
VAHDTADLAINQANEFMMDNGISPARNWRSRVKISVALQQTLLSAMSNHKTGLITHSVHV